MRSSGRRRPSSCAACSPVLRGMLISRIARSMSSWSARLTASSPSAASATTFRSGSALRRSVSPLRTISWSSATSTRVTVRIGTLALYRDRHLESDLDAAGASRFDCNGAADDQRALADASQAPTFGALAIEALPVVDDAEHDAVGIVLERERHFACAAVSCGVGQAFLRNSVKNKFNARIEPGESGGELSPDRDAGPVGERACEVCERAGEVEMVKDLRAQLLRRSPDVFEARLYCRLRFAECHALLRRRVSCDALEQEEHAGHRLADLVVEAARDPLPLFFLGVQCSCAGLTSLRLEAFHHPVEGLLERADLAAAVDGHALATA